jgi:hypothetical protein
MSYFGDKMMENLPGFRARVRLVLGHLPVVQFHSIPDQKHSHMVGNVFRKARDNKCLPVDIRFGPAAVCSKGKVGGGQK